ncbi:MAG: response regulator transcription factor [Deltaproteobacteria bacterium]|nr:response regulator transcription factor [Deltaproteobacteria bacterium]
MTGQTDVFIRVLVIDDDRKLCRLIEEYLNPMGYQVHAVHDGAEGLVEALSGRHHVVILDVMMPRMDGFEVLRRLRKDSEIPVLMLTARGEETDRIVGLEIGADDYLPKTFSARELLARLRSVTRRSLELGKTAVPKVQSPVVVGDLRVEPSSRTAFLRGEAMVLTPVEFDLLAILAAAAGRVLSRDQLLDAVAGREYEVFDRSVDVHVSSIRKKLGDDPRKPRYIKTVRSAGYLFLDEPETD